MVAARWQQLLSAVQRCACSPSLGVLKKRGHKCLVLQFGTHAVAHVCELGSWATKSVYHKEQCLMRVGCGICLGDCCARCCCNTQHACCITESRHTMEKVGRVVDLLWAIACGLSSVNSGGFVWILFTCIDSICTTESGLWLWFAAGACFVLLSVDLFSLQCLWPRGQATTNWVVSCCVTCCCGPVAAWLPP